jgi:integrase
MPIPASRSLLPFDTMGVTTVFTATELLRMAKTPAKNLTVKYLESLERKVRAKEKVSEWHPDGDGLYLRVLPSGRMSFELRRRPFKPYLLGGYDMGLPAARKLAAEARAKQALGVDPAVEKAEAKLVKSETFGTVMEKFIERHAKPHMRGWAEVERCLAYDALPKWKNTLITHIKRSHIGDLIDEIVDRGSPRQAAVTYAYIHNLFRWAVGRGYVETNPAEGIPKPRAGAARDRVLSEDELRLLWRASDVLGPQFGPIMKLLAFTGQRKSEIACGLWSEIDVDQAVWKLPGSRTKNKQPHRIPLSNPVLEIIKSLPRFEGADLIFTNTGETPIQGFGKAKARIDARLKELNAGRDIPEWTWHDLRRTAATGMASLSISPHVIEMALNHISGFRAGVGGTYNRHQYEKEVRAALDAWAMRLNEIVAG